MQPPDVWTLLLQSTRKKALDSGVCSFEIGSVNIAKLHLAQKQQKIRGVEGVEENLVTDSSRSYGGGKGAGSLGEGIFAQSTAFGRVS